MEQIYKRCLYYQNFVSPKGGCWKIKILDLITYDQALLLDMAQRQSVSYMQPETVGGTLSPFSHISGLPLLRVLCLSSSKLLVSVSPAQNSPLFPIVPEPLSFSNNLLLLPRLSVNVIFVDSVLMPVHVLCKNHYTSIKKKGIFQRFANSFLLPV